QMVTPGAVMMSSEVLPSRSGRRAHRPRIVRGLSIRTGVESVIGWFGSHRMVERDGDSSITCCRSRPLTWTTAAGAIAGSGTVTRSFVEESAAAAGAAPTLISTAAHSTARNHTLDLAPELPHFTEVLVLSSEPSESGRMRDAVAIIRGDCSRGVVRCGYATLRGWALRGIGGTL